LVLIKDRDGEQQALYELLCQSATDQHLSTCGRTGYEWAWSSSAENLISLHLLILDV